MDKIRRALVPGSFDPPTIGHYDLALRAAEIFDEVYVTAFSNGEKHGRFDDQTRLRMLETAFDGIPNIICGVSHGLLADFCREKGIRFIVKGSRSAVDFDYELSMSLINRSLNNDLDTIVLPTRAELQHVSSTMISELIKYGKDYSQYLPEGVAELISEYTKN